MRFFFGAHEHPDARIGLFGNRNVPQLDQRDRLDFARGSVSVVRRGGMCVASS